MSITNNIQQITTQIAQLEQRYHYQPNSVRLLLVSKKKSISDIEEAIHAGQFSFAENYTQEALVKIQHLKKYPKLEWHYIGHIQNNKVKYLARYFDWVQTLATEKIAAQLNQACEKIQRQMNICLQVNISAESDKKGTEIEKIAPLARYIVEKCPQLCLRGLMAVGLATQDQTILRHMLQQLSEHYRILKQQYTTIDTLSMGMSDSMALAVACGSTMVRIGTAIFGRRDA